jgi:POT family proton-dependent oligopeptide transporter
MGINVGAFLSPFAATWIRNFLLKGDGFIYNARIPGMAHQFLKGTLQNIAEYEDIAKNMIGSSFTNLTSFSNQYIASLGRGYNAGFAIASVSIIISLLIFLFFKKYYKHADYLQKNKIKTGEPSVELTPLQSRNRVFALIMVFAVVIFFWMAFHQNGLILTVFAKNYTVGTVGPITKLFFDLPAFLSIIAVIIGLVLLIMKRFAGRVKLLGLAISVVGAFIVNWRYGVFSGLGNQNAISAELFQSFNPIFVVFMTPVILGIFAFLRSKDKEPSSPRKIGIGMLIMGFGWLILITAAVTNNLASPQELVSIGGVSSVLTSPYWLISMYFGMTIAELFISPMGLAYVAKVSPPKFRGTMQGGWLAATAVGNLLSGVMAFPYAKLELWQTYSILVVTSCLAGGIMFAMLKKLNRLTAT